MVDPDLPWTPRSVGEVFRTDRLPNDLVRALSTRFKVTREDVGTLSSKHSTSQGLHAFLGYLSSMVDSVLVFDGLTLLGFERDGTVHLLHSLFSVPVSLYSMA